MSKPIVVTPVVAVTHTQERNKKFKVVKKIDSDEPFGLYNVKSSDNKSYKNIPGYLLFDEQSHANERRQIAKLFAWQCRFEVGIAERETFALWIDDEQLGEVQSTVKFEVMSDNYRNMFQSPADEKKGKKEDPLWFDAFMDKKRRGMPLVVYVNASETPPAWGTVGRLCHVWPVVYHRGLSPGWASPSSWLSRRTTRRRGHKTPF